MFSQVRLRTFGGTKGRQPPTDSMKSISVEVGIQMRITVPSYAAFRESFNDSTKLLFAKGYPAVRTGFVKRGNGQ
jgi:hypothetical protein